MTWPLALSVGETREGGAGVVKAAKAMEAKGVANSHNTSIHDILLREAATAFILQPQQPQQYYIPQQQRYQQQPQNQHYGGWGSQVGESGILPPIAPA